MAEKVYSVSQLNKYIKGRFDDDIILHNLMIKGEVSNFKLHSSGHCYFTLKDTSSNLKCVAFRTNAMNFRFSPQNGMKIIAVGYISVYDRDGVYQLYVKDIFPEGVGERTLALEALKKKLLAEGLFDDEHKKEMPFYPKVIGVVTSKTGAVIKDICQVANRRNSLVKIVLYSVHVQGENAPKEIVEAIEFFNKKYPVDILIVGRGGGSVEDLWAFNEEGVVRSVYNSKIPVISAVGHETDYTLVDLVSDVRASTPSQASELAVPEYDSLVNYLNSLERELKQTAVQKIEEKRARLNFILQSSGFKYKDRILLTRQQNLDNLISRLQQVTSDLFVKKQHNLELLAERLAVLNPLCVLKRGFSIVEKAKKQGKLDTIYDVKEVKLNEDLYITLAKGKLKAKVVEIIDNDCVAIERKN